MANTKLPARLLDTSAVPELTVTGDLTVDTSTLKVDSTNNRIGIGTTSPSQRLHVDGGNALIKTSYDASGTTNSYLYFAARASGDWRNSTIGNTGNALVFSTGGTGTTHTNATERMRILGDGTIGVGTSTPGSKKVKIVGSASAYPLSLDSTDSDYALEFQRNGTSEWWLKASSSNFHIHENGSSDHLTVASGGNVGIAQTSPAEKLHVNGVIRSKAQKTESMQMFNIASGTYTAGSWYNFTTRSAIANFGYGNGFYIWHIYDDTYLAGGGNYFINYCSEPFYFANVATNAVNTMEFGMNNTVAFGHAANGGAASRVKLRLAEEYGVNGADADIQWAWNGSNNLTINQAAGRRIYIYLHKIGGE